MNIRAFRDQMERYFDPYTYNKKRHPKAAKKRRIDKKWRKRFGPPMKETIEGMKYLTDSLAKRDTWTGSVVATSIPFVTIKSDALNQAMYLTGHAPVRLVNIDDLKKDYQLK